MADESVRTAYARLLGTLDEALPYIERLCKDARAAVAAVVAAEDRKAAFAEKATAQLGEIAAEAPAGTALGAAPSPAPAEPPAEDTNPFIDNDPKAWIESKGPQESRKGMRLSECEPEYLDAMAAGLGKRAAYFDKMGNKGAEAEADRKLAALATDHATRMRAEAKKTQHRTTKASDMLGKEAT